MSDHQTFKLPPEAVQKLQEFQLKRQNFELAHKNMVLEEEVWILQASRQLGKDLYEYQINFDTGVCTPKVKPEVPAKVTKPKLVK